MSDIWFKTARLTNVSYMFFIKMNEHPIMLNPTSFTLDTPELSINMAIRATLTVALIIAEVYS